MSNIYLSINVDFFEHDSYVIPIWVVIRLDHFPLVIRSNLKPYIQIELQWPTSWMDDGLKIKILQNPKGICRRGN